MHACMYTCMYVCMCMCMSGGRGEGGEVLFLCVLAL